MNAKWSFISASGLTLLFAASLQLHAASGNSQSSNPVFRIGSFDRSSVEFASGSPKQPVKFVVGKSDAAKDWYAAQPAVLGSATADESPASAAAPRSILFTLDHAAAPSYRLHVSLLIQSASVPALRVGINGKHGIFYLHPKLDYSNGDQGDSFYPAYSQADVEFTVPGSALRQGENTITLQAVEEADQAVPEAGLTYDAIELDRGTAKAEARSSTAQILPTIYFRQRAGGLEEEVEAYIRSSEPMKPGGHADLTIAGRHYQQALRGNQDFGEERLDFSVAEFPAQTRAAFDWQVSGHRQHVEQTIDPKKKWTVFVVPNTHVDVGYSDYQAKIAAIQSHALDEALDMIGKQPDFRFSTDGAWNLEQFMKTRTPAQQQRAIAALQKEQLFVPAQYANILTGFPAAETLIRSLYPSANFSRMHGTPFNYANLTDVPSYSWSYASILASAGIHYLAGGSNNYRAPVLLQGRLNEDSPIWWEGPDGKKVLLWYSRIYQQMQMLFGLPPVLAAGRDTLPLFLQMYEHPGYHASATMLYGTQVENTDLFPQQAELVKEWDDTYAFPHLQYSGFHEALQNIQKQFGDTIPTTRGDGGPYWEDGIASDAYYAGMERWTEGNAPTAEKLATLTALINPLMKANTADLKRMWTNMLLMDEHTWDSYNSISDPTSMEAVKQLAIKDQYAVNAKALANFIAMNSMASMVSAIPAAPGSLIVFNSLNWKRDGLVSFDVDKGNEIVDTTTGKVVPAERLGGDGNFDHIRFLAQDIPAVGYKVFEMRHAAAATPQTDQVSTLESPYYKVTLDSSTGAVRSIYDKQLQRELVNQQSPYRFGQYLYVSGGDKGPNTVLQYSHVYPKADLEIHPASSGRLVSITHTPYGAVAHLQSEDTNTPSIRTEIRLFNSEKKIEFIEDVDKKEVDSKEAVYFAFPFAMTQPQFQYEVQNGVVDPAKDMYPGAGHEWFSVQHWVSVQQEGMSGTVMPLDASLVTLGDINRGAWPEQFGKRPGTIFSYVMNNYWDTNYRAGQGGHFHFHYIVTSAPSTNAQELSHLGWEEITPLQADTVTTQDKAISPIAEHDGNPQYPDPAAQVKLLHLAHPLDAHEESFLKVEDANVVLTAWKTAEDGNGTILRFLDLGGQQRTVTVQTPLLQINQAWQADAVERNQAALPLVGTSGFTFTIHPHEIVTVRITGTQKSQTPGS